MITTAFFDPSARSGKQHDFKAIVLGSMVNAVYYVRWAYIRRCTAQDVLEMVYRVDRDYPETWIGFEDNGFQILYKDLMDYKAREKGYSVPIHGQTTVSNKETRIESLSGFVENGDIRFLTNDKGKYAFDIGVLIDQLLDFPDGKHDDGPDALYAAFKMARNKSLKAAHAYKRRTPEENRALLETQRNQQKTFRRTTRERQTILEKFRGVTARYWR